MNEERNPILAGDVFKKIVWRQLASIGEPLEKSTTWTLTGVAAITALLVGNIASVSEIISEEGIKLALWCLVLSILVGALSKLLGLGVMSAIRITRELETTLNSDAGRNLMDQMDLDPSKLMEEVAKPFLWPMSLLMARAGKQGTKDYLKGDKILVKMFCFQLYLNASHMVLGAASVILLVTNFG